MKNKDQGIMITAQGVRADVKTRRHRVELASLTALGLTALGLAGLAGCASPGQAQTPTTSGFLTHYCHLEKVDDLTWRYVNSKSLSNYEKFRIGDVTMLATYFEGTPVSEETKRKIENYVRQAVTKALSDRYSIVSAPGSDVADIRVAITAAYKTESQLGLTVESEILDSYEASRLAVGAQPDHEHQLAAVTRTELSQPYFSDYWNGPAAKELINQWAMRLRKAIDASRGA
ncbi:MAG TPA: DUF3313 family protein [Verrucomicrobiae bacterium]|jgi:hypothetical protein|nr:DUF3313 family protein [Verrucomicrobiae bacterium]